MKPFAATILSSGDGDERASGPREPRSRSDRLDAGEPRSPARRAFDPRTLPRRPGVGRTVAVVVSLLTVVGVGAGGGYLVRESAFVRPALVRGLPPVPVPEMNLLPVHAANASVHVAAEEAVAGSRRGPALHTRSPGDATRSHAILNAGTSMPDGSVESRTTTAIGTGESGRVQRIPLPARQPRSTDPVPPALSPEPPGRTRPVGHDDPGASRAPALADGVAPGTIDPPDRATVGVGAGPRSETGAGILIRRHERTDRVAAPLRRAHDALLAGDDTSAAEAYRAVLGHEPGNRDARFGLAAVAARAGRWDEAAAHYTRVLASDPADTAARAALIALHEEDPARGENGVKALLRSEPQAAHLHFVLGNLHAAQSRWPEAQRSYFHAYRLDRGNPDYAYNLAVSLDHLSRSSSALRLYGEAFDLSRTRPASFENAAVRRRIRDLESPAGAGSASARATGEAAVAAPVR